MFKSVISISSFSMALVASLALAPTSAQGQMSDYTCKVIDGDWAWFSDHALTRVTYVVSAAGYRQYQVGTGVSLWGKPRGRIRTSSGLTEATTFGNGAIHVRFSDGKGPGQVCVALGDLSVVTLPEIDF